MLVVVAGLPGTGKTTVARALAADLGAILLGTDELRKGVLREPGYSERKKRRVYDELLRIAADLLGKGRRVVLDGTFFRAGLRRRACRTALQAGVGSHLVEVVAPPEVALDRLEKRRLAGTGFSEADRKVYYILRRAFEPIRGAHFIVDTADEAALPGRIARLANKIRVRETGRAVVAPLRKAGGLEVIQTHISWVLLGGEMAHKIKKPVRFSFLDYTTLEKRRLYCRREVRLNARLSPDLYLGVVPIRAPAGRPIWGGRRGRIVEYAVRMKALPQEDRLDRRLAAGRVTADHFAAIARILADFHRRAGRAPGRYGTPQAVAAGFAPAFEVASLVEEHCEGGAALAAVRERVENFLASHGRLLRSRIAAGRIRRGHGDIRSANIFLHRDRIFIFDAVEFNDAISDCDAAADLAFLAMDLHFFRRPRFAELLVAEYVKASGDNGLGELIDFYMCYRALVRMMAETYVLADPDTAAAGKGVARRACRKYLRLAVRFAGRL